MSDLELLNVLGMGELDLRTPLRTWRARIEAVCAECFPPEEAAIVFGHLIRAAIDPQERREQRRWARAAGKLLRVVWRGADGRSAVARGVLLALADRADRKQQEAL